MALKDAKFVKDLLGVRTEARVYEAARLGLIPCVRIGRQVRFDESILRQWITNGGTGQPIAEAPASSPALTRPRAK